METSPEIKEHLAKSYVSAEEILKLIKKYQNSKTDVERESLREQLVINNVRFIQKLAIRFSGVSGQEVEDLFQEGVLAFMRAVDSYKPRKKIPFINYVGICIERHFKRYYDILGIRVPWEIISASKFYHKLVYEQKTDKQIENTFIKKKKIGSIRYDVDKTKEWINVLYGLNSSTELGESYQEDGRTYHEKIADPNSINAEEKWERESQGIKVRNLMDEVLNDDEQFILFMRHFQNRTLDEIGGMLGVRRERIRQIESRGIRKMRETLRRKRQAEDVFVSNF